MTNNCDDADFPPYETIAGNGQASGLLLICDHASPAIPARYDRLGLSDEQLARHIAYDIGARAVTVGLARALGLPAVLSTFSRLLIDPNRGADDPTLVMRISDGALIAGNARIDAAEIARRKARYYEPYHDCIDKQLAAIEAARGGRAASIFSIHSFTPTWRGVARPWEVAILWDADPRMPEPIIAALRADPALTVGDNEPYDGALLNDCLYRHGTSRGRAHALIELRQDLIADQKGVDEWVQRLVPVLAGLMNDQALDAHCFYPSRTGVPLVPGDDGA